MGISKKHFIFNLILALRESDENGRVVYSLPGVIVVQHNFHDFILSENKRVCVTAVYGGIGSVGAGG